METVIHLELLCLLPGKVPRARDSHFLLPLCMIHKNSECKAAEGQRIMERRGALRVRTHNLPGYDLHHLCCNLT